jgi:hypothetical protein
MKHRTSPAQLVTTLRRGVPRLLVAAGAAALSLGFVVAVQASPAAAATGLGYDLNSGTASFTAGGHTWNLQVSSLGGQLAGVKGTDSLELLISTPYLGGTEVHTWNASSLPGGDFTVTGAGHATLKTGGALSPVITLSLAFTPKSHAKMTCSSGFGTDYSGVLSGTVSLTTGLKGLAVSKRFTFGKPTSLEVAHACTQPIPCIVSAWTAGDLTSGILAGGDAIGTPGHFTYFTTVARTGGKTASKALARGDLAYIAAPAPVFSSAAKTLTVQGSASGAVTGKGVLGHATLVGRITSTCVLDGKTYTASTDEYSATFTSSKAFQAHTLLTGTITVTSPGEGFFSIVTLKKK